MKERVKKYILFMFGNWKSVEENQLVVTNIKEVMETIIVGDEFSFVTGDNVIIMCLNSKLQFEEIDNILHKFLISNITAFFLMVKPRKLGFRLEDTLKSHLFGLKNKKIKKHIDPRVAEELSKQLKMMMSHRMREIKKVLDTPSQLSNKNNLRKPFTVDSLLDKIIDEGLESLTEKELEFLDKYNT